MRNPFGDVPAVSLALNRRLQAAMRSAYFVESMIGRLIREVDCNSSGTAISSTDTAAVESIFGYTGCDWDSDIGMQYNRARWYDPQTGRWLSQDTIGS
ncbi:RHS repeat-associated core domain-containing protein [Pirellulaceae bacterium SH467]